MKYILNYYIEDYHAIHTDQNISTLSRGTKLELSEINYLKSISGKNITIFNKSFLSFSPIKLSIEFQDNEERSIENENCIIEENKENILEFNKKEKKIV